MILADPASRRKPRPWPTLGQAVLLTAALWGFEAHGQQADPYALTTRRPGEAVSVSVYGSIWTNSRLPTFPYNLVTGNLTFRSSHGLAIILSRPFFTFALPLPGGRYYLDGMALEAEAQVMKHFGGQSHAEASAALVLRSGQIALPGGLSMNVAVGNGLSHAFADAALEIGRAGLAGVNTYRTQYHLSFETAFSLQSFPHASLFFRLHHRSGIYGVISPRRSGANFLGGGLRWTFY